MAAPATAASTRPLSADDLQRVIEIDALYSGRRREGFFAKRLQAALAEADAFVYIGCDADAALQGFLLARLQQGDYGSGRAWASLDAIGVDPACGGQGFGRTLLGALDGILRHKGIAAVQTQSDWRNLGMLKFFAASGFALAPRQVLERSSDWRDVQEITDTDPGDSGGGDANDYSGSVPPASLARDAIRCRSLTAADLDAITRLDQSLSGRSQRAYYEHKIAEALDESGIRVSLVAERDARIVGFAMARVDFGEFDRIEAAAVLDSIAVAPDCTHQRVGTALLSQLLANLSALRIEILRTECDAEHLDVLRFLYRNGFTSSQRLAFVRELNCRDAKASC